MKSYLYVIEHIEIVDEFITSIKKRYIVILYDETYTPRSTKQSIPGWKCRALGALVTCRKTPTIVT